MSESTASTASTVRAVRRQVWLLLGAALLVVGVVLSLRTRATGDFGWFAYAPLQGTVEISGATLVSRGQELGAAVIGLGLLIVTGALAYRIGVRRGSRSR